MDLLIYGITGVMGRKIEELALKDPIFTSVKGLDRSTRPEDLKGDIIIDFSHKDSLDHVLDLGLKGKLPIVIGTTGYSQEDLLKIKEASKEIPILHSSNMSLGMNIMFKLVEDLASYLKDSVDIEVVEAHHNRKKDAPSGSAVTIVESIEKGLGQSRPKTYGRSGQCERLPGEIGIHAIRAGNIVGYHEASFVSELENIKVSHEAYDRSVFAQGSLTACKFLINKKSGLYHMKDLLNI